MHFGKLPFSKRHAEMYLHNSGKAKAFLHLWALSCVKGPVTSTAIRTSGHLHPKDSFFLFTAIFFEVLTWVLLKYCNLAVIFLLRSNIAYSVTQFELLSSSCMTSKMQAGGY